MSINQEDNLSLEEVLEICRKAEYNNIEVLYNDVLRPKTFEFLTKYDFDIATVKQIIKNLTKEDYQKGPVEDYNPNYKHPFWIFTKHLESIDVEVYIKIKIINHKRKIIVFSFHKEGEYEL